MAASSSNWGNFISPGQHFLIVDCTGRLSWRILSQKYFARNASCRVIKRSIYFKSWDYPVNLNRSSNKNSNPKQREQIGEFNQTVAPSVLVFPGNWKWTGRAILQSEMEQFSLFKGNNYNYHADHSQASQTTRVQCTLKIFFLLPASFSRSAFRVGFACLALFRTLASNYPFIYMKLNPSVSSSQ